MCAQSCLTVAPRIVALLSTGFSGREHCSGLPFPSPGDLPHPGIEPEPLESPALAGGILTTKSPGKPHGDGGPHPTCWDPELNKWLSEGGVSA